MLDRLRIGLGSDVHAFEEGRPLMIGGVEIPHDRGLLGHSDADVLLHAIVDSILGALSEGDIGQHFPPSEPRWKGAPSIEFVKYVRDRVRARKAKILSIDCVLTLEKPKISPYSAKIRETIASALQIEMDRIHVKATTAEKLGFTGREEGIAAQAVCLLALDEVKS